MTIASRITDRRKRRLCGKLLGSLESQIVFVDVGAGGPLKHPWTLLPTAKVAKIEFDPEIESGRSRLPVCISNAARECSFHIARDPRGSSLHVANPEFVRRFGQEGMLTERTIPVRCVTLDQHFAREGLRPDVFDINTEGHDFQVLQGAERIFAETFIKVVKIEFELAAAWCGQGWFSDIDPWMRTKGFDLVAMDLDHIRPSSVARLYHPGEPVWGKAVYVPGAAAWRQYAESHGPEAVAEDVIKAVALCAVFDIPGRALEALQLLPTNSGSDAAELECAVRWAFQLARWDAAVARLPTMWRLMANRVRDLIRR